MPNFHLYIALPAEDKGRIPASVWPDLLTGRCANCRRKVLYNRQSYDAVLAAVREQYGAASELTTVCPPCGDQCADLLDSLGAAEDAPVSSAAIEHARRELKRKLGRG